MTTLYDWSLADRPAPASPARRPCPNIRLGKPRRNVATTGRLRSTHSSRVIISHSWVNCSAAAISVAASGKVKQ
jgi:hypothetical protein